ncbi:hypothetical protein [Paraburkholderia acidisoli]|uniref:Uncharacterized protein n=1 Tax=Paraburkholderia acidisoli TaxID=2571748 RepID=A0A7Z2GSM6_9BURK|nr:hypothetical protein [Paraburkholderia acidisoli]QGZ66989.1 hypothetical protein FAZ98_34710 [Paraburkholderia acidisoli]
MYAIERAWVAFMKWPFLVRRAVIGVACYLVWIGCAFLYHAGVHDAAIVIGITALFGCFFALGGWYVLRGALHLLAIWLRVTSRW